LDAANKPPKGKVPFVDTSNNGFENVVSHPVVMNTIENFRAYMDQLWLEATRYDSINPTTKYATFSQSNEAAKAYEQASTKLAEATRLAEELLYRVERRANENHQIQFSDSVLGRAGAAVHSLH
jgi:hypothetical protein